MIDAAQTIERLLADAEQLPDPRARALAKALAAALIDLVGAGLGRVIELADSAELVQKLADDDLVGSLMVLAGIHPDPVQARAVQALERNGAELGSIGVKLDGVDAIAGGGVRVRVSAELGGVADPDRVRAMVEAIVVGRAPDCETVVVELSGAAVATPDFVPADRLKLRVIG